MPARRPKFQYHPAKGNQPKASYSPIKPKRKKTAERGYDIHHQRLSKALLIKFPLCAHCGKPAELSDHIVPINDGGARLDPANRQSLCWTCHNKKTGIDTRRRRGRL